MICLKDFEIGQAISTTLVQDWLVPGNNQVYMWMDATASKTQPSSGPPPSDEIP
jgi:hypothetical protein